MDDCVPVGEDIKEAEEEEFVLTSDTMFDILSKKITNKFWTNTLFTRLAISDWEGEIRGQGDIVRMKDYTDLIIDKSVAFKELIDQTLFLMPWDRINLVSTRIAKSIQEEVESVILAHQGYGNTLYFAGQVVRCGGYQQLPAQYHDMKFAYGFKIQ